MIQKAALIAKLHKETIYLYYPRSKRLIDDVKTLSGRSYTGMVNGRCSGTAKLTLENVANLEKWGFKFNDKLTNWKEQLFSKPTFDPDFFIPGLNGFDLLELYQKEGIQMLDHWNGRALLADDQGLGKTVQALGWIHWRKKTPTLIICPSFAKWHWYHELRYWLPESYTIQMINTMEDVEITGDFVIISYAVLVQNMVIKSGKEFEVIRKDVFEHDWECLLIDEAHYLSNFETQRSWAVRGIAEEIDHVIPITATPGRNRPKEFFIPINIVNKQIFPGFFRYAKRYCAAKLKFGVWDYNGASNLIELHELLMSTVMIRRRKEDIFADLPAKKRIPVPLEIDNRKEYKEARAEEWSRQSLRKLMDLAVEGKMKGMLDFIDNMLETNDKLVLFAEHKKVVDVLMERYGDIAVKVDGSVADAIERDKAVTSFQCCKTCGIKKEYHNRDKKACREFTMDMEKRVFIGSKAAKEIVTLTCAYDVIFCEMWWSPKDHDQAEDRVYGRKGDLHGANCWYLIAENTIEEVIVDIYDIKNKRLDKVMDGRDLTEDELLGELLKKQKEKKS
jgi:SWI/SNF-related matrix-associated actin-dependent regulator 1 of chromatin subfamily A